jgi:hypothetical protein
LGRAAIAVALLFILFYKVFVFFVAEKCALGFCSTFPEMAKRTEKLSLAQRKALFIENNQVFLRHNKILWPGS